MYRVQFFCPRQSPNWQEWPHGAYRELGQAVAAANQLIWQFHSARVIDPWGRSVYQV
jgi:hypothetical protein